MTAYILVAASLTAIALLDSAFPRSSRDWGVVASFILIIFGAFRYETGYDWLAYETFFSESVSVETAVFDGLPKRDIYMEPLYEFLNMLVKSVGGNATFLFVLIGIFNISVLHAVTGKISKSQSLMWAIYFGLLFPIAQMSILRQALASSFVLIGLWMAARQERLLAAMFIAVGAGFQATAVVFLPLVWLGSRKPDWRLAAAVVGVGLIVLLSGAQLIDPLIDAVRLVLPSWLVAKLDLYYKIEPAPLPASVMGLIAGYGALLYLLYARITPEEDRSPFINLARWLTLGVVAAHLFFAGFPGIWYRVMCVSLPWQIAVMCGTHAYADLGKAMKFALVSVIGAASMAALVLRLDRPEAKPFVPYQSLLQVWLYGDPGDGRARSEDFYVEFGDLFFHKRDE